VTEERIYLMGEKKRIQEIDLILQNRLDKFFQDLRNVEHQKKVGQNRGISLQFWTSKT
jgi:hypothetical protein